MSPPPFPSCLHSECVYTITGEFGVVYKAQYTEPEGDIGYKTSTVAVKTLKGKIYSISIFKYWSLRTPACLY